MHLTEEQVTLVSIPYRQARYGVPGSKITVPRCFNSLQVGQVLSLLQVFMSIDIGFNSLQVGQVLSSMKETKDMLLSFNSLQVGQVPQIQRFRQSAASNVSIPYRQARYTFIQLLYPTFIQVSIPYRQARYPNNSWRIGDWELVSIPYRQARYLKSPLCRKSFQPVSIPYRQARYFYFSLYSQLIPPRFNSLQVGQVRAASSAE